MSIRAKLQGLSLAFVCSMALIACPEGTAQKPSETCSKAYDKCMLPTGVLGICDMVDCVEARGAAGEQDADSKAAPCLICRSQH